MGRGVLKDAAQLAIDFTAKVVEVPTREITGMVRGDDGLESQHGAVVNRSTRFELQQRILWIIATEGAQNAEELEMRVEFRKKYGPSTVRKRISELYQDGKLVKVGRRDNMAVWDIPATPK